MAGLTWFLVGDMSPKEISKGIGKNGREKIDQD
jgi:hypothetical protein